MENTPPSSKACLLLKLNNNNNDEQLDTIGTEKTYKLYWAKSSSRPRHCVFHPLYCGLAKNSKEKKKFGKGFWSLAQG